MENILIAILKAGELVFELCSTVYEKLRPDDDDTSENGREQSPNGEDP